MARPANAIDVGSVVVAKFLPSVIPPIADAEKAPLYDRPANVPPDALLYVSGSTVSEREGKQGEGAKTR